MSREMIYIEMFLPHTPLKGEALPAISSSFKVPFRGFRGIATFILVVLLSPVSLFGQRVIGLEDAITLARQNSPDAVIAKTKLKNGYWQYKTFRANYYPSLTLDVTTPDLNRELSKITLPSGEDAFVQRNLVSNLARLSLSQQVATGGTISVVSSLQRLDILNPSNPLSNPLSHSFLATPAGISFTQPVFGYNSFKWSKKTEPQKYKIAKRQYAQDIEDISLATVDIFYNLLNAQSNLQIAQKNKANNDTIYNISVGRFNLGKLAENDLLQIKLNLLNADLAVQEAQMDVAAAEGSFKSYLGLKLSDSVALSLTDTYDSTEVSLSEAWGLAQRNSVRTLSNEERVLESAQGIAVAKGNNGFRGNLYASYGFNQSAAQLNDVYIHPEQEQEVNFGLTLPILDWGKARGIIETAKAADDVTVAQVKKDNVDFEQEIYLQVTRYNLQRTRLRLSKTADDVAQRRYFIAKARYMIGKIDLTDLNIAQNERDNARRNYVESMRTYWKTYFGLRRATLYDFKDKKMLDEDVKVY